MPGLRENTEMRIALIILFVGLVVFYWATRPSREARRTMRMLKRMKRHL